MATIESLNPSLLTLNKVEQITLLKTIRLERRTQKLNPRKLKATKKKPAPTKTLKELAALLSPKQKALLRAELLGGL